MKKSKFVIFKDSLQEWRFNLVASNGKIIAVSEGYKTKQGVLNGIQSVLTSVNQMLGDPIYEERG